MPRRLGVLTALLAACCASQAHAHKFVRRKAVAVAVPTAVTVQEQRTTITNTRNNNDAVNLTINRQQELVDQQVFLIQNPIFATAAGVPVSQFAYCQPASNVQYGASYMNQGMYGQPQQSYVNPQALPQGGYAQTQKSYAAYIEEYKLYVEALRLFKAVKAGEVPASGGIAALAAPEPKTAIQQTCIACHSGPTPKGGLDLSDMAFVSCEQRLAAIGRVTSDDAKLQMPPAGRPRPDPSAIGALVQELSDFASIRSQPQNEQPESQPPAAEIDAAKPEGEMP